MTFIVFRHDVVALSNVYIYIILGQYRITSFNIIMYMANIMLFKNIKLLSDTEILVLRS